MQTISHTELKKRAVLTESNDPTTGKIFNNNGIYKVWNGRTYVRLGEENLARLYDNVADFPKTGEKGLLYRLRLENHFYVWDGFGYRILGDMLPELPTHALDPVLPSDDLVDGEYVLKIVGGVSTWGLSSGGALVYDAYLLGSSVNDDVSFSIYHKFDGVTEEPRNDGIDLTDGQEYLVQVMYQNGLTDAHILDSVNIFTSKSFADQSHHTPHPDQIYGDSGNPILGQAVKAWVNAGATIMIKYDSVFGALKATLVP